jgi:outer membrane protein assembly factor BamB
VKIPLKTLSVKHLIPAMVLLGLSACGGQPDLEATQAVAREPVPEVANNSAVEVAWRAESAGGSLGAVPFEPVAEGNDVFTASPKGQIRGFDLETGNNVFSHSVRGSLVNGVGVNANSVVVVTNKGEVVVLDRSDGSERWRYDVGRSISAAPALNDRVIVIRTVDGHVIGLNAVTGDQVWSIERPVASLSLGLDAPGLIAAEGLVSGFSSGRVLASNVFNGSTFWEKRAFRPGGKNEIERLIDIDASPVQAGDMIIIGAYQGGLVAYRLRSGEEVWRNEDTSTRKPIAVSSLFLGITGPESDVALIARDTGKTRWKRTQLRGNGLSAPVITDESVIVGNLDGDLYFYHLTDGAIKNRFSVGTGAITALLKVDQGVLVYSAGSGKLTLITGQL